MKRVPILVFGLVILLAVAVVAEAAVIKIKVASANVRQKPDATSAILSRVSMGAMFEASKKVGNFYEISITDNSGNLVTGYISADVVEEVGPAAAPPTAPAQAQRPQPTPTPPATTKRAGGLFIGAGLAMTNLTYDADTQKGLDDYGAKKKMKLGFQLGVGYELPLSQNISIVPGLFYSTLGTVIDYTVANQGYSDKYSYGSLIIPVEVKLSFNGPFVSVGPYLGYLITAKYFDAYTNTTYDDFKADDQGRVFANRIHFGISLGAGIDLDLGGMGLMVKAGYQLGLSNLHKSVDSSDTFSIKHNAILILAAVKL